MMNANRQNDVASLIREKIIKILLSLSSPWVQKDASLLLEAVIK